MQNQRGFIGLPVLIAILLGIVVLGGGAYYVVQQQTPTQTASDNLDNLQTLPTNTTTSNPTPKPQTTSPSPATVASCVNGPVQTAEGLREGIPVITSITPASGPKGTAIKITGCNLSGFEGDHNVTFERADGVKTTLVGAGTYQLGRGERGTFIEVTVKEPCQKGETVTGAYSGIESQCNFVGLTPGTYKVSTTPWGTKSNEMTFTITSQSTTNNAIVSEKVTCVFNNATMEQKCYGDVLSPTVGPPTNYSCTGVGECAVEIKGPRGTKMTLYSGCSGSAGSPSITIDGSSEYANFSCGINKVPIISSFTGATTLAVNQMGTWKVEVTDPENDKLRYVVAWGDEPSSGDVTYPFNWPSVGSATEYTTTTFTHTYKQAGTYTATVYVVDNDANHVTSKTLVVTVGN